MALVTQITAKIVYDFLVSEKIDEKKRKAFLSRLAGTTGSDNELLTVQQLNIIFEGSPSLREAFEARQKNSS
jgi:hypothetical protein